MTPRTEARSSLGPKALLACVLMVLGGGAGCSDEAPEAGGGDLPDVALTVSGATALETHNWCRAANQGAILNHYQAMGGSATPLGSPASAYEQRAPDGQGCYQRYAGGTITWHPSIGAYAVYGDIHAKWQALVGLSGFLGYPLTDESPGRDGSGGRYNTFQGGHIFWRSGIGAFEVHGEIAQRWMDMGAELSRLGYPTSDERDSGDGGRVSYFQGGAIRWRSTWAPLTFYQQNMALMVSPAPYKGTSRSAAIDRVVAHLRAQVPDVVGLSEVFADDERATIRSRVADLYPYYREGPDEADLESDGGLLLLSRHPIVEGHQTVFRHCTLEDCLANKGVLHARIRVAGHPADYDVFLSHTQNPDAGGTETARPSVQRQMTQMAQFIQAYSSPTRPSLLMGDLNTDGYEGRCSSAKPNIYWDMMNRLGHPEDLWTGAWWMCDGITFDSASAFSPSSPMRDPADAARKRVGERLDHFLRWRSPHFLIAHEPVRVEILQPYWGRDLSDHYGLTVRQTWLRTLSVDYTQSPSQVRVTFNRVHCLTETEGSFSGVGGDVGESDEVWFRFTTRLANGATQVRDTPWKENVDFGEWIELGSTYQFTLPDPGASLTLSASGEEVDYDAWFGIVTGRAPLGTSTLVLSRNDLLSIGRPGSTTTRVLPLLTGTGSEYAVTVTITVQ